MSVKNVKIICGANYGDEGKGLTTDYFVRKGIFQNNKVVNVLHNGSCQRSHTVSLKDGYRHAFQHFGAGTYAGADTFFASTFIVNPIYFHEEYTSLQEELKSMNKRFPNIYAHEDCMIAIPYDAFLNQVLELSRGNNKHGSCGYGVFETVKRYENSDEKVLHWYKDVNYEEFKKCMRSYFNDFITKLKQYGITDVSTDIAEVVSSEDLVKAFYYDIQFFFSHVHLVSEKDMNDFYSNYESVVFEGGQGLLLDKDNKDGFPHLTPSKTGSYNPAQHIMNYNALQNSEIEICYVTRTYLTRHGAGGFPTECKKEEINSDIIDLTNVPNPYQNSIRYGYIDLSELLKRILKDYVDTNVMFQCQYPVKSSIMITQMNYTNGLCTRERIIEQNEMIKALFMFDNIYTSDSMTARSVKYYK